MGEGSLKNQDEKWGMFMNSRTSVWIEKSIFPWSWDTPDWSAGPHHETPAARMRARRYLVGELGGLLELPRPQDVVNDVHHIRGVHGATPRLTGVGGPGWHKEELEF